MSGKHEDTTNALFLLKTKNNKLHIIFINDIKFHGKDTIRFQVQLGTFNSYIYGTKQLWFLVRLDLNSSQATLSNRFHFTEPIDYTIFLLLLLILLPVKKNGL